MKLQTPICPICGQRAIGTVDTLRAVALLDFNEAGTAEFNGTTEVNWDSQATLTAADGGNMVICPAGHEWLTIIKDGTGK